MLKRSLLLMVLAGTLLLLSGCGLWGCWGGHHGHDHSHHRDGGHSGYRQ